jgi:hypothetical protein
VRHIRDLATSDIESEVISQKVVVGKDHVILLFSYLDLPLDGAELPVWEKPVLEIPSGMGLGF